MKLSNFDFKLPPELLAEYPAENRDEARLMVVHRDSGEIEHRLFKDLIEYFDDGDSMIINNTKVFPARMYGNKEKTGATIEVFLLRELNAEQRLWDVIVDPARKIRIGNKLFFGDDDSLVAEVIDNTTSRGRTLRFLFDGSYDEFRAKLLSLGETPLPKYIKRKVEPMDQEYYQTIYAKNEGAVAAPTAGLHFTPELFDQLKAKGVEVEDITLHVGLGTFRPMDTEDIADHHMHSEFFMMDQATADRLNQAKAEGRRIIAVGTTSCRTLEAIMSKYGEFRECHEDTDIFIFPGYSFQAIDGLITNFHLPESTLVMLVSALAGREHILNAYEEAIRERYRFFSFGDAMFIVNGQE